MFPIGEKEINELLDMKYIKDIYISGTRGFFYNTFIISGAVTFEKDNSSFSQRFKGESIADVYNQIYEFCRKLNE